MLLKYDPLAEEAIRSIGLDPIFVHYWTDEQIAVYERNHKILYLDASGSLMKKVKNMNGELCSHIYLYQGVTQINSKTAPVFQMISATQNTNAITYWLMVFLRIGSTHKAKFPTPKEVVTDFDRALLGAVSRAFAKENTLADYLHKCYQLIRGFPCQVPPCMLRLNVCHFMNIVAKWKCWATVHGRIRQTYLRSLAALRQQSTIECIENHATAIFTLALNANLGPENSTAKARNFLTALIRGIAEENERCDGCDTYNDDASSDEDSNGNIKDSDVFKWVAQIYEACEKEIAADKETNDLNAFYCPAVVKKLKKLLPYFPMFSDVMPPIFGYGRNRPTSAAVE